jgi:hypothetical protein
MRKQTKKTHNTAKQRGKMERRMGPRREGGKEPYKPANGAPEERNREVTLHLLADLIDQSRRNCTPTT